MSEHMKKQFILFKPKFIALLDNHLVDIIETVVNSESKDQFCYRATQSEQILAFGIRDLPEELERRPQGCAALLAKNCVDH